MASEHTSNGLCGIYTIVFQDGDFYVGQSIHIYARWRTHVSYLRRGKHYNLLLQQKVNDFGLHSLQFGILDICKPEELDNLELYYIKTLKPQLNIAQSENRARRKQRLLRKGRALVTSKKLISPRGLTLNVELRSLKIARLQRPSPESMFLDAMQATSIGDAIKSIEQSILELNGDEEAA